MRFCFNFHATRSQKKIELRRRLFLSTTPPAPFKYGYWSYGCGSTRLNEPIALVVNMELKKIWTSVTYEEPIILIIKADHSFLHLRSLKVVPKIWLDLWKIHLQQLVVVHGGSSRSGSLKGSMDKVPQGWCLDRESMFRIHVFKCRTPRGYSWELLVGVCRAVPQMLTLFQTKNCHFSHPFSDQTSKIQTRFQIWPLGRNYVIIT